MDQGAKGTRVPSKGTGVGSPIYTRSATMVGSVVASAVWPPRLSPHSDEWHVDVVTRLCYCMCGFAHDECQASQWSQIRTVFVLWIKWQRITWFFPLVSH